ncbi:MAG: hypothetical protein GY906_17045 [bacterium]|nr:hypothetical protein [bacterium]
MQLLRQVAFVGAFIATTVSGSTVLAADPSPREIVQRIIEASGGAEQFTKIGILRVSIDQEERTAKGESKKETFVGYTSTERPELMRLEMPGNIVLGIPDEHGNGWATVNGVPDTRPPTAAKAQADTHVKLLPVMLPFSLSWPRLNYPGVQTAEWEGEPAWLITMRPPTGYFGNPIFEEPWGVYVSKKSMRLLAAEFYPPPEQAEVVNEGVRFNVLRWDKVGGISLPGVMVMEGVDLVTHLPNGHLRTIQLTWEIVEPADYTIFYDPTVLEKMDNEEF